jgi:hypothetical protein
MTTPLHRDGLLAAYDGQLRTDAEMVRARDVRRLGPLLCAIFDHGGFVSYRDLDGVDGDDLDAGQFRQDFTGDAGVAAGDHATDVGAVFGEVSGFIGLLEIRANGEQLREAFADFGDEDWAQLQDFWFHGVFLDRGVLATG